MRILLSAFAFSPYRGSEAAVGWNIALGLCHHAEVTVLHGDVRGDRRGQCEMADYLKGHSLPKRLTQEYVEPSQTMTFLERCHSLPGSWMLYYTAYRLWQKRAFARAQELHKMTRFDVCHQLTYIGFREPGFLWQLGIPFVWGPVSGAESIPLGYYRHFRLSELFRPLSREVGNVFQQIFPGRIRRAAQAATKVFAVSLSEKQMLARWGVEAECLLETGTTESTLARVRACKNGPLQLIWSGLFTPRKALPILLRALAGLGRSDWRLTILGDGPSGDQWRGEASRLGLADEQIAWMGRLSRDKALAVMAVGDLLIHTGLREGTPHVVLESLSLGLPVICHNAGGMGTAVNDSCGIRVPLRDFEFSVEGFRVALARILSDRELLTQLSTGALKRSSELSWESFSARLAAEYTTIIENRRSKVSAK